MARVKKDFFETAGEKKAVRINKYLSESGMCSRREADAHIAAGNVQINGVQAKLGDSVLPVQTVTLCGKKVKKEEKLVLIAFHKPQGIVCTTDPKEPDNIIDFINYGSRIYPIGRLDKDSEGLILLTNDGDIVNKILRAGNRHEKEYIVKVNKLITAEFLTAMSQGVPILDTVTKPCFVEAVDKMTFRIILTQGLNRQIRRMCEYLGYRVVHLTRIRIMNVNLGRLKTGGFRNLTEQELEGFAELIKDSSDLPFSKDAADRNMAVVKVHEKKSSRIFEKKNLSGKKLHKSRNMTEQKAQPFKSMKSKDGIKKESSQARNSAKEQGYGSKAGTHKRTGRNFK